MTAKRKRMTQREKDLRARTKKELQEQGVLPPDKPRLNRKKFVQETWSEFQWFLKRDPIRAQWTLLRAIGFLMGPELPEVTAEQVGICKLLKVAVEYDRFLARLEAEGRKDYSIGELVDEVVMPVWKL